MIPVAAHLPGTGLDAGAGAGGWPRWMGVLLGAALLPSQARAIGARAGSISGLAPERAITQYVHDTWTADDGLPRNNVRAILQTRDGYLLLASQPLLVRFDGVTFAPLGWEPAAERPYAINHLLEDRAGQVWVSTPGQGLLCLAESRLKRYATAQGLPSDLVQCSFEDREGTLWAGTARGLARLVAGRFLPVRGLDGGVHSVHEDTAGTLWLGTDAGVRVVRDGRLEEAPQPLGLRTGRVRAIAAQGGSLFFGADDELVRWESGQRTSYTTRDGLPGGAIRVLLVDRRGTLWVGTSGGGIGRLAEGRLDTYTSRDGLTDDAVTTMLEDREGSLWVGTAGGGLDRFRDAPFATYTTSQGLPSNRVWSVYEDSDRNLWIGTEHGLARLSAGRFSVFTTREGLPSNVVYSTSPMRGGGVWIGTADGVARVAARTIESLKGARGFPAGAIYSIYEDRSGALWMFTAAGLMRRVDGTLTAYGARDGLLGGVVLTFAEDALGNLWIGTSGGLHRFQGGRFAAYTRAAGLPDDSVGALHADAGDLWIGTAGGMALLREGTITALPLSDPSLPTDVLRILDDGRGHLWWSSSGGVLRADKQELLAIADRRRSAASALRFARPDGLRTTEMNAGSYPAGWRSTDGRLWFPNAKGLAVVDPGALPRNPLPPPVHVERLLVDGREVPVSGPLDLPPGGGRLEFHYTALSLAVPARVRFRYRLAGSESGWTDAGSRRSAFYTGVPGGRYRFEVVAANNDGVWNEVGDSLSFRLRPHVYETRWFLVLGALALMSCGAALYRLRSVRVRRRLAALVAERTRALEAEVAERRRAERALSQARDELETRVEERTAELAAASAALRGLFEGVPVGLYRTTAEGSILDANENLVGLLGYPDRATLLATNAVQLWADPEDRVRWQELVQREGEVHEFESRMLRRNGKPIWVRISARVVRDAAQRVQYYEGALQDITERKRADEMLNRSHAALVELAKSSRLYAGSLQEVLRDVTEFAARTLEVERASVWLHDEARSTLRCVDLYERAPDRHASGQECAARDYPSYFQALELDRVIAANDARCDPRTAEFRASYLEPLGISSVLDAPIRFAGRAVGVVCHEHVGPPRSWSSEEQGFVGAIADMAALALEVSERLRAQDALRQAEAALRRGRTMAAMGELVAGVAHEVRNPLFGISACLDAFEARAGAQSEYARYVVPLRQQVTRLNKLMEDLLDYGRPPSVQLVPGRLEEAVAQAIEATAELARQRKVRASSRVSAPLPSLMLDPSRMLQVFTNLLQNAVQHTPAGGNVSVELHTVREADAVWLEGTVSDTGPGFAPDDLPRVFTPFFSRRRGGTGLGLAIVQTIVAQHGGRIEAANRAEGGAIVRLRLPATDRQPSQSPS